MAKAVGTTQLFVSGIHGQPNLSGSRRTCRSVVRNFHFQNQFDSFPAERINHSWPCNRWPEASATERRAMRTRDVVHEPRGSSPTNAGQLPFGFCTFRRKVVA